MEKAPVFEGKGISISFSQYSSAFKKETLHVIRDLSVKLVAGEIVAVVGASGSGKSLLAHAILGILPYNASLCGEMYFGGEPLTQNRISKLRGKEIVLVPQSVSYLDPLMKVGPQIRKGSKDGRALIKSMQTLERYGLGPETEKLYPFELSGGMARRVLISTAVMENPKLVIADEPTPGLHKSAAQRVLGHFREMADEGAAVLFITHDLELAAKTADRVVVFYSGTTLEEAGKEDFNDPGRLRHPYTKALWNAMPKNGFQTIEGMQPYAGNRQEGCPFRLSCEWAGERCKGEIPYVQRDNGYVRCVKGD